MANAIKTKATYDPNIKVKTEERSSTKGRLLLYGVLACLTGLGAVLGIPMLIAGFIMSSCEKGSWVGDCPKCSSKIYLHAATADTLQKEFSCPSCHSTMTLYDGEFVHTPPV